MIVDQMCYRHFRKCLVLWLIATVALVLQGCPAEDTSGIDAVGDITTFELPPLFDDVATDPVADTQPLDLTSDTECLDDDGDGVCNIDDICSEGDDTLDEDEDGVPDACDACEDANDNDDADEDGVPDACDICPVGDDTTDTDGDGTPDACDCDEAGDLCHANAYCVPIDDGVECHCLDGFEGDGVATCDNIDECSADATLCVSTATCVDNYGGFTCDCNEGSFGDPYAGGSCDPCDVSCSDCTASGPTGCSECSVGFWDADADEAFNCTACAVCADGTYQHTACTLTADTVCEPCHTACTYCSGPTSGDCTECGAGQFLDSGICTSCSACDPDTEYETIACTDETNRECATCSGCSAGFYESGGCVGAIDSECTECGGCGTGFFEDGGCTGALDTNCTECGGCGTGFFENGGCTGALDTNCTACNSCGAGFFEDGGCTGGTDTICTPCDDRCATCNGTGPTACTACATGYMDADPGGGFNCVDEDEEQFFYCTEEPRIWVVPDGVTEIDVEVYGAEGGDGIDPYGAHSSGGLGGRIDATISVTPGETLYVHVGCQGEETRYAVNAGGWNGGGDGGYYSAGSGYTGGGGGGASDVRRDTDLTSRIIVAGGGAGGGACDEDYADPGGDGGNTTGENGGSGCAGAYGRGGSQASGGAAGSWDYVPGTPETGSLGNGGDAYPSGSGGGGGGGYYGGGAGDGGGGGGGSSYAGAGTSYIEYVRGVRSSDGEVVIRWYGGACALPCATCNGPGPTGCTSCTAGYVDADPGDGFNCVDEDREQYFYCTGEPQMWVVPDDVEELEVEMHGAEGGDGIDPYGASSPAGRGGRVDGMVSVTSGDTIYIYVGCQGEGTRYAVNAGGWNGGGDGGYYSAGSGYTGGGGGGASDIRTGPGLETRIAVAAGGGGGGACDEDYGDPGGDGGNVLGADGGSGCAGAYGRGGSQSSGGAAGSWDYVPGTPEAGSLGYGGDAPTGGSGGGGGAGYYGGGAGDGGGGGGGSSYVGGFSELITWVRGARSGDGRVIVRWTSVWEMVEDFETGGTWPWSPWVQGTTTAGGTIDADNAHDGALGIDNVQWYYRTDVTFGSTPGQRLSMWAQPHSSSEGIAILGFSADSTGTRMLSLQVFTSEFSFRNIINDYTGWQTPLEVAQTYEADVWYRMEVEYNGDGEYTGRLYSSDGTTLLNEMTHDFGDEQSGGIAIRSYPSDGLDTIELSP